MSNWSDMFVRDIQGCHMWQIDRENEEGKSFLRLAKRAAMDEHGGKGRDKAFDKLYALIEGMPRDALFPLGVMYMLQHPDTKAYATGAGAVWAVATRIVNDIALRISRERPTFEVM